MLLSKNYINKYKYIHGQNLSNSVQYKSHNITSLGLIAILGQKTKTLKKSRDQKENLKSVKNSLNKSHIPKVPVKLFSIPWKLYNMIICAKECQSVTNLVAQKYSDAVEN